MGRRRGPDPDREYRAALVAALAAWLSLVAVVVVSHRGGA